MPSLKAVVALLALILLLNYAASSISYHRTRKLAKYRDSQPPLVYPFFLPHAEPLLSLAWNPASLLRRITNYKGGLVSTRVNIFGYTICLFQDRETVKKLWKTASLSSSISLYMFSMRYLFGAREPLLSVLRADDSGPFPQPYRDSKTAPNARLHHTIHAGLARGLTGPALGPTSRRYRESLRQRLGNVQVGETWTEFDDLGVFIKQICGASVIEAVFGPTLLSLSPTFVKDLWRLDSDLPLFAKGLPSFLAPSAFKNRRGLIDQIQLWYKHARANFDESRIDEDGDGDPIWGSKMIRDRQKDILKVLNQDDESLATLDLGLAWAAVANSVPTTLYAVFHVFRQPELLNRVRQRIALYSGSGPGQFEGNKNVSEDPLLSSIYAETLRLYIDAYAVVTSPHEDTRVGQWLLPKGTLAVLNTAISHMDKSFWNTQDMRHPVDAFWAERFLVDPADPSSGPARMECRPPKSNPLAGSDKPYFSVSGVEGSWFPFGGGAIVCPGRFFSKAQMIFTFTYLVENFDIEVHCDSLSFNPRKDGLGAKELANSLPFRMRRRPAP